MYIFVLLEFVLIYYDISMEYYVAVKKKREKCKWSPRKSQKVQKILTVCGITV